MSSTTLPLPPQFFTSSLPLATVLYAHAKLNLRDVRRIDKNTALFVFDDPSDVAPGIERELDAGTLRMEPNECLKTASMLRTKARDAITAQYVHALRIKGGVR